MGTVLVSVIDEIDTTVFFLNLYFCRTKLILYVIIHTREIPTLKLKESHFE